MIRSRSLQLLALVLGLLLVLAACGEGDEVAEPAAPAPEAEEPAPDEPTPDEPAPDEPTPDEPTPDEPTPDEPTPDEPVEDGAASVAVAASDHGDILVDGDGMTVYLFEPDEQGEPTCYDECAANWPPLVTDADPEAGEGADPALLGTAERTDGTTQVTYDGWPLYHWAGDAEPGDVNGQGVNDVWWVLDADGVPVQGDSAAAAGPADY